MDEFSKNPLDAYPSDIRKWLSLIMISDDKLNIIGSIAYRKMRQFADVDLIEQIEARGEFTPKKYQMMLVKMCHNMIKHGALFSDIKVGFNENLKVLDKYLGKLNSGMILNFDKHGFLVELNKLLEIGLLSKEKFEELEQLSMSVNTVALWEDIKERVRLLYTLHWSLETIQSNQFLQYCFDMPSIKVDFFIPLSNAWVEISTVHAINVNGRPLNYIPVSQDDIYNSIALNCEKYLFSPLFKSTYKGLKRLWILARMKGNVNISNKLLRLINSDVNNLYIAGSYLETMALIKLSHNIRFDLSHIKWLISHCTSIDFNIEEVFSMLDKCKTPDDFKKVKNYLKHLVNDYSLQWIYTNALHSDINLLLGNCHTYSRNL